MKKVEEGNQGILRNLSQEIESVRSLIAQKHQDPSMEKVIRDNFDQLQDYLIELEEKIEERFASIKSDTSESLRLLNQSQDKQGVIECLELQIKELMASNKSLKD